MNKMSQVLEINQTNDKTQTIEEKIVMEVIKNYKNPFESLTVKDVSKDLHIGINQAYELFKQNDFPTITIGKKKRIIFATYLLWKLNKKGGV